MLVAAALLGMYTGCTTTKACQRAAIDTRVSFGEETPRVRHVLVAYATRTGSTASMARVIGASLGRRGFRTDVVSVCDHPSPAGYDALVIGSAVNGGRWLPEAMAFLDENLAAIRGVPVAVFTVHAMNLGGDAKSIAGRRAYLDLVHQRIVPVDEVWFPGVVPPQVESSFFNRWIYRAFGGGCEGDCRDWSAVSAWAEKVHAQLPAR